MGKLKDNEKARREELGPALPAIQRYSIGYYSDEWGVRSLSPTGIYDDAGPWVRYEDHVAVISALRAQQPAPAPSLDAWQPIETAPKDGEAVILTEGGKVFHGGFITIDFKEIRDSEGNFIDQIDPDEYWMNFDDGDVCTPTHWMPKRSLPMPPDAAKWGTPAPAVQEPVVQDDIITIRKPTTSAEMLWLLKLAHLVISDVDKTLEKTFAPAQELRESFTDADMATASARGFRDGVGSLSANTGEPFGWVKQSEIDTSKQFGGSINLWRRRYDCDVPVYLAAPITSAEGVGAVCGPQASGFATDSVTAPAGGETYHLGACIVDGVLSATVMRKERGCSGDVTVLLSEQIPVDQLRDRDVLCHSTAGQPVTEPAKSTSHGQAPASVLHLVHSAFAEIAMAFPKAFALHKVGIADTAVREALAAPVPPPECETEAEKRAFAFGWFKALESERMKAESAQEDAARYCWVTP